MAIAQLMSVPQTSAELEAWQFANQAHHRDIARRIQETKGVLISDYPLEPFNPDDADSLEAFLQNHQDVHQQMDIALGLNSYNLSELDWQDPAARAQWFQTHFVEHNAASQILGVS
jgi:hypothetical protein